MSMTNPATHPDPEARAYPFRLFRVSAHRATFDSNRSGAPYTVVLRDDAGNVMDLILPPEIAASLVTRLQLCLNAEALAMPSFDAGKFEVQS